MAGVAVIKNRAVPSVEHGQELDRSCVVELRYEKRVLRRFRWGRADVFGQPAYWAQQAKHEAWSVESLSARSFVDEVCFCLLGGYGITAELNKAAFTALLRAELISQAPLPSVDQLECVLRQPLEVVGRSRPSFYRFPRQRAERLAEALEFINRETLPEEQVELRNALCRIRGIGPKTASWIVRNAFASDAVAIIDVHVIRGGVGAGVFDAQWRLPRDYYLYEAAFLGFADCGGVPAGRLDLCMWSQSRELGSMANRLLRPPPEIR